MCTSTQSCASIHSQVRSRGAPSHAGCWSPLSCQAVSREQCAGAASGTRAVCREPVWGSWDLCTCGDLALPSGTRPQSTGRLAACPSVPGSVSGGGCGPFALCIRAGWASTGSEKRGQGRVAVQGKLGFPVGKELRGSDGGSRWLSPGPQSCMCPCCGCPTPLSSAARSRQGQELGSRPSLLCAPCPVTALLYHLPTPSHPRGPLPAERTAAGSWLQGLSMVRAWGPRRPTRLGLGS